MAALDDEGAEIVSRVLGPSEILDTSYESAYKELTSYLLSRLLAANSWNSIDIKWLL